MKYCLYRLIRNVLLPKHTISYNFHCVSPSNGFFKLIRTWITRNTKSIVAKEHFHSIFQSFLWVVNTKRWKLLLYLYSWSKYLTLCNYILFYIIGARYVKHQYVYLMFWKWKLKWKVIRRIFYNNVNIFCYTSRYILN